MKKFVSMQLSSLLKGVAIVVATSFAFSSCTDDDNTPNGGRPETDDSSSSAIVTNYKTVPNTASVRGMRRAASQWSMPELPTSFDGMTRVVAPDWKWGGLDGNTNFYVAPGDTQDYTGGGLSANNRCNLYVYGKLILPSFAPAQGANIYIAPGGELVINGKQWNGEPNGVLTNDTPTNLYIYNGATYTGSLTSASKTGLYVEGDVRTGNVEFGGTVMIGGTLTANNLTTNNSRFQAANVVANTWVYNNDSRVVVEDEINIGGDVTINAQNVAIECKNYIVGGNFHMENNSVLYAYEHMQVMQDCEISTQGIVETPCLYVKQKLYVKNCATMNVARGINCGEFEASASGFSINMGGDALFNAGRAFTIQNKDWAIRFANDADHQSAIVADKFQIMEGQAAYITGYVFLSASEYWGKPSENKQYYVEGEGYESYTLQETVKVTINGVKVNSAPESCTPEFETPTGTPEPPTVTELISSITHTHDISATCVAVGQQRTYFSWHKRGTSIHGCLEALTVINDIAELTSWMETDDDAVEGGNNWDGNSSVPGADELGQAQGDYDFNHLIVAENQIVTVGDHEKMGGFIGAIPLDANGDFGQWGRIPSYFRSRQLLGSVTTKVARSGNTVLYNNGRYYIACAGGFQEYAGTLGDIFTRDENNRYVGRLGAYQLTEGSAKHIAINPAGTQIATLELTSRKVNDPNDEYWFNDTETAIEATLKVRPASDWLNTTIWQASVPNIAPIYGKNAIAMDAQGNVYVSAGMQGLRVYNNGSEIAHFLITECPDVTGIDLTRAGANGVAIDDNYVYVAYGLGGLWVLNKSDLSVVSWYKSNAPEGYTTEAGAASANYVAVDGQYIYVAYGRHGVKVLKLN